MTEAQKMRKRHRQETTALYVKTYNKHGNMRDAAKALGISAATLCKYFADNRIKFQPRKLTPPTSTEEVKL